MTCPAALAIFRQTVDGEGSDANLQPLREMQDMTRPGPIGQPEDVAAVVADVLGSSNLIPSDLTEVQAKRIT